ncbi:hypothetical protein IRB23SM22_19060 [Alkalibacterium sp. s-m-22]|uniref:Uncharacterized protein n=1 Tax=Alkalibacterium indicireducens TaxID=398758 RepID=A0ABN1AFR7_9LACT
MDIKIYNVIADPIESGISRSDLTDTAITPNIKNNIAGDNMLLNANSKEIILLNTSPLFLKLIFSLINYN